LPLARPRTPLLSLRVRYGSSTGPGLRRGKAPDGLFTAEGKGTFCSSTLPPDRCSALLCHRPAIPTVPSVSISIPRPHARSLRTGILRPALCTVPAEPPAPHLIGLRDSTSPPTSPSSSSHSPSTRNRQDQSTLSALAPLRPLNPFPAPSSPAEGRCCV
jgi:hypothetical protein